MKQILFILLVLSCGLSKANSGVEKKSISVTQQSLVENGLRLPVSFGHDKTFTVEERLLRYKVPGLSFALIKSGKISWVAGYGSVSVSSQEAVTPITVFQAASIAKPATAFGVMRMRDKGVVNIDKNIEEYLFSSALPSGKQNQESPVTFKNLLNHSSGLSEGGYMGYEKGENIPSDVQTFNGVHPAKNKPVTIESAPDTTIRYSGAGYTLVEITLSDIFKQPFEKIMDDWVLSTVGMKNSSFDMNYPYIDGKQVALGHDNLGKQIKGGWRLHPEQAAAGLWSTPTDLATLAIEVGRHIKEKASCYPEHLP
ncbi:serine hydrolase domain-containing protein [Agaribacter marinus]|uniref:Beta-lactamase-related domain-containing protein n=1 Tax=Agaribacter marinus TaxID=1431249 RepID=A0AA37WKF0_9ALTE|nr:serine hydrolase domain-containing protein [Agaribacter marinus]GLR71494.1 hypothetical protein GCM10007852_24020 [Agaribacter marinus]